MTGLYYYWTDCWKVDKMVSVIVPVYNAGDLLARCIDSILAQSYSDFELLLVNDGSTDNSGRICDAYAGVDKRVKALHKENGGVSSARNLGLEYAKGAWVCFFDADDSVPVDTLENFVTGGVRSDVDAVIGCYAEILEDGTEIVHKPDMPYHIRLYRGDVVDVILKQAVLPAGYFGSSWVILYRRELLTANHLKFPIRRRGEDWLFNINVFELAQSAVVIDKVVYHYHRNDTSAMSRYFPEQIDLWRENRVIRKRLIAKYGFEVDEAETNGRFVDSVMWYCFNMYVNNHEDENNILKILCSDVMSEAVSKIKLSAVSLKMRPGAMLLAQGLHRLSKYYLHILSYGLEIKRRIKRKI